jgi:hypothetical protein
VRFGQVRLGSGKGSVRVSYGGVGKVRLVEV